MLLQTAVITLKFTYQDTSDNKKILIIKLPIIIIIMIITNPVCTN